METLTNHPEKLPPANTTLGLIGDLDGNFSHLEEHLENLHLISKRGFFDIQNTSLPNWNGGDTQLILSGDILADRTKEGFKILLTLSELREQAERKGGSVEILAGNHEERMIGFLMGRYPTMSVGKERQYQGMRELQKFGNLKDEILSKMRESEESKILLQEICAMKLIILKGNTIHSHTPLTGAMLDTLGHYYKANGDNMTRAIEYINTTWQGILTKVLLGENIGTKAHEAPLIHYILMANTFLHTLNGTKESITRRGGNIIRHESNITPIDHPTYNLLKKAGVDTMCHGHTNDIIEIPGFDVINLNRRSKIIKTHDNGMIGELQGNIQELTQLVLTTVYRI